MAARRKMLGVRHVMDVIISIDQALLRQINIGLLLGLLLLPATHAGSSIVGLWQKTAPENGCMLFAGSNRQPNEGPTDYSFHLRPIGKLRAIMIFVDFPDAPESERTEELFKMLVPESVKWFKEVSYGRMSLDVTPVHLWHRMSKASSEYSFSGKMPAMTFDQHRTYIEEAIQIADKRIDYRQYKIVFVVAAKTPAIPSSPAFHAQPGRGILADGVEIRHAATFGMDIRKPLPMYASNILIHETGHLIGLPDLHDWKYTGHPNRQHAGGWDTMSSIVTRAHFTAWHKLKLGWLDPAQIMCLAPAGSTERTITPLAVPGGLKAIVVPVGPSQAYVIEVRQPVGQDSNLCDRGVLIYTVDAAIRNGSGPLRVIPAQKDPNPTQFDKCAMHYNAAFDIGPSEVSTFEDSALKLKIEVLSRQGSSYKIRATRIMSSRQLRVPVDADSGKCFSCRV